MLTEGRIEWKMYFVKKINIEWENKMYWTLHWFTRLYKFFHLETIQSVDQYFNQHFTLLKIVQVCSGFEVDLKLGTVLNLAFQINLHHESINIYCGNILLLSSFFFKCAHHHPWSPPVKADE